MRLRSSRTACIIGAALIFVMVPVLPAVTTYEKNQSTETGIKVASYSANVEEATQTAYQDASVYKNKAIAVIGPYIDVLSESDTASAKTVGRLYENTVVDVIEVGKEWTLISSGNCKGYVLTSTLVFSSEAEAMVAVIGEDKLLLGYTLEEALAKEAAEEAARKAEEERLAAEAEAARIAAEEEERKRQAIIDATASGTDFTYNPTMEISSEEIWILACVIDWEACNQPYEGKLAVANVVLNRVRSGRYPDSVTEVVYQSHQFSGVSNFAGGPSETFKGRLEAGPRNEECMQAALEALSGTNNVEDRLGFRTVWSVDDISVYGNALIIADHVFH